MVNKKISHRAKKKATKARIDKLRRSEKTKEIVAVNVESSSTIEEKLNGENDVVSKLPTNNQEKKYDKAKIKYKNDAAYRAKKIESVKEREKIRKALNPDFKSKKNEQVSNINKNRYHMNARYKKEKLKADAEREKVKKTSDPNYKEARNTQLEKINREKYEKDVEFKEAKLKADAEREKEKKASDPNYKEERNRKSLEAVREKRIADNAKKEIQNEERAKKRKEQKLIDASEQMTFRQADRLGMEMKIENLDKSYTKEEVAKARAEKDFTEGIREVPDSICTCCEVLYFKNNVLPFNLKKYFEAYNANVHKHALKKNPKFDSFPIEKIEDFEMLVVGFESGLICSSCSRNFLSGRFPLCHPHCGIREPIHIDRPEVLKILSLAEERLVTPCHPFMQLTSRTPFQINPQHYIRGGVINIIPDMTQVLSTLPAKFDECSTIQLQFKRDLKHQTSFMHETIRVQECLNALHFLIHTPIYQNLGIQIDEERFKLYDPEQKSNCLNFIVANHFEKIDKKAYIPKTSAQNGEENQDNDTSDKDEPLKDKILFLPDEITIQNENEEQYTYKNMSSFNSIFHGIVGTCILDDIFYSFIRNYNSTFFRVLYYLMNQTEGIPCKWIDFIVKTIPEVKPEFQPISGIHQNFKDMHCDLDYSLFKLLNNEYSSFTVQKCCETCFEGKSMKISAPILSYINRDKNFSIDLENFIEKSEKNIIQNTNELYTCTNCLESIEMGTTEVDYGDLIYINVSEPEKNDGKKSKYSDIFDDIPHEIRIKNEVYDLKFLTGKEEKNFHTYLKNGETFIEMNTKTQNETLINRGKFKINPALLAYFKRPIIGQNYDPIDTDQIDCDENLSHLRVKSPLEDCELQSDKYVLPSEIAQHMLDIDKDFEQNLEEAGDEDEDFDFLKNEHVLLLSDHNFSGLQKHINNFPKDKDATFNSTLVIAPGQGKPPVPSYKILNYDAMCWPTAYCGYPQTYDRKKISYTRVIRNELCNWDRTRFKVPCMLFKAKEKISRDLASSVNIACRKCQIGNMTKKDVTDPDRLKQLISKNVAYQVLPQIRTSNEYLMRKESRAKRMLKQFGFCNIFLTCGIAETFSPELLRQMYKNIFQKDISEAEALNLDIEMKNQLIRDDPVSCVEMYHHRMQVLEKFMKRPKDGLFGDNHVTHYMDRTENQMRGSLHSHKILWCKDAPTLKGYETKSDERGVNEREVIAFADKHISTKYIENHPNMKFQIHKHTQTCYKKGDNKCRFHFPRYVSDQTLILYPQPRKDRTTERLNHLAKIQEKMNQYKENRVVQPFEEMLKELGLTRDQYYDAVRCDFYKITILYKRESDAVMVNNYNPTMLNKWEGNHDIQVILDAYACIHYLFKYCLKVDEGVNHLMEKAVDECRKGNLTVQETFRRVANVFHNASYLSAQQAIVEIKGYPVVKFSNDEVYINTFPFKERAYLIKPQDELDLLGADSKDFFIKGLIEEYSIRPKNMEKICLADFAALYAKTTKSSKSKRKLGVDVDNDEESTDDDEEAEKEFVHTDQLYRQRTQPRVIRYVGYNPTIDYDNYCREMVMLFLPWRNEEKELINIAQVKGTFKKNEENILKKFAEYNVIDDSELEELKEKFRQNLKREVDDEIEKFLNEVDEEWEETEVLDEKLAKNIKKDEKSEKKDESKKKKTKASDINYKFKPPDLVDKKTLHNNFRSLNRLQQEVAMHINHLIRTVEIPRLTPSKEDLMYDDYYEGLFMILQGQAGVGKTFTINIIKDLVNDYYSNLAGADFEKNKVLVCAPTGIAAFLINGYTIHSAFAINEEFIKRNSPKIYSLGAETLNRMRSEFDDVKVIIVDEYSMCSRALRTYIDQRLREICNTPLIPFGGKIVIFTGDLFQLPPVKAQPIYQKGMHLNENDYQADLLWEDFRMFELTEPVRQKNPQYVELLYQFGRGYLTKKNHEFLLKRVVTEDQVPDDCIWVFYTNEKVDMFNEQYIKKAKGMLYESISTDDIQLPTSAKKCKDQLSKEARDNALKEMREQYQTKQSDRTKLKHKLLLKLDIRYKLTSNLDVSDGLAKGAMGILKHIIFENNKPKVLYLDFYNKNVGKKIRQKHVKDMKRDKVSLDLVPIEIHTEKMTDRKMIDLKINHEALRTQFPVTPCQASTIHSVQGLTVPKICIDNRDNNLRTDLAYVALSRTDYENVYILGHVPIPTPRKPDLLREYNRLSNAKLRMSYYNFDQNLGVKIAYHNVNGYKTHKDNITSLHWYWNADIIILSEANTQSSDEVDVRNGFHVVYPPAKVPKAKQRKSEGLIIMCRNSCKTENLSKPNVIRDANNKWHIDLRSFEVDGHLIITGYRHPNSPLMIFQNEVNRLLDTKPEGFEATIMGDMNINMNSSKAQNSSFYKFLKKHNFYNYLENSKTNVCGSQIDLVFSTSVQGYGGTVGSYFSDHFSVFFQTKINVFKLPRKHKEYFQFLKEQHFKNLKELSNEDFLSETKKDSVDFSDEIKQGISENLPFFNDITACVEVRNGLHETIKFENLDAFNSVFAALYALFNYTKIFRTAVEHMHIKYSIFKFILQIKEKLNDVRCNKNEMWINFLCGKYPDLVTFSEENIKKCLKNMTTDVVTATQKLLVNWVPVSNNVTEDLMKGNEWCSYAIQTIICNSKGCGNIYDAQQRSIINILFSVNDSFDDLITLITNSILNETFKCPKCKNVMEIMPIIDFSQYAIFVGIQYEKSIENTLKISISQIPKLIEIKNLLYSLRIVIGKEEDSYKTFYRIKNNDFLEIVKNNISNSDFIHNDCDEELKIEMLVYVKSIGLEENEVIQIKEEKMEDDSEPMTQNSNLIGMQDSEAFSMRFNKLKIQNTERKYVTKMLTKKITSGIHKNVPFTNKFHLTWFKRLVKFVNMCPFNAVYSAFSSLCTFDKDLFPRIKSELESDFKFIKFISRVKENFFNSDYLRNAQWIELIDSSVPSKMKEVFEETQKEWVNHEMSGTLEETNVDMAWDVEKVIYSENSESENPEGFFANWKNKVSKKYFQVISEPEPCKAKGCIGYSEQSTEFMPLISDSIPKVEFMREGGIESILMKRDKKLYCNKCGEFVTDQPRFTYSECLILRLTLRYLGNYEPDKIELNKIRQKIILNNDPYVLKVIIDHPTFHFQSLYRLNTNEFLLMNDTDTIEKVVQNMEINPVIFIYVRSDEVVNQIIDISPFDLLNNQTDQIDTVSNESFDMFNNEEEKVDLTYEPMSDDSQKKESLPIKSNSIVATISISSESSVEMNGNKIKHTKKKLKIKGYKTQVETQVTKEGTMNEVNRKVKVSRLMAKFRECSIKKPNINNAAIMTNCIKLESTGEYFVNLCSYNSILHGFIKSMLLDDSFFKFIKSNRNTFEYFETLIKLLDVETLTERQEIWIKFLHKVFDDVDFSSYGNHPFKGMLHKQYNMVFSADEAFHYSFPNFSTYECTFLCSCGNKVIKNNSKLFISCSKTISLIEKNPSLSLKNCLQNFTTNVIARSMSNTPICNVCKEKVSNIDKIDFSDMIMIQVAYGDFRTKPIEEPLNEILTSINVQNTIYTLKFIAHYEFYGHRQTNHYYCYVFDEKNNKYYYVDDATGIDDIANSNCKVFPTLICYFKK